jgi:hypothetical protein
LSNRGGSLLYCWNFNLSSSVCCLYWIANSKLST